MKGRTFVAASNVIALVVLVPVAAAGQSAPRTPWGDPDLQGTYTNKTTTPLQRPDNLADREFLSEEEVAERERAAVERNERLLLRPAEKTTVGGNVGAYNNFWLDGGTRPTGRTSLIFDPPNGRLPALTPEAERFRSDARRARAEADTWEDLELNDRCLIWQAGPPMLPSAYNNNFMVLQTPDYVVIQVEMIHDTRIIPLDGRGHLPSDVRLWNGDMRGHWDGDTLVIETTNLPRTKASAAAVGGDPILLRAANGRSDDTVKIIERITRVDADTLNYEFTIEDPTTWVTPFSGEFPMRRLPSDELLYEYACHEGNYSMEGILGGERVLEKAAASAGR
ncbi:MAG: hypothetical protein CL477_04185 [Acidobacteria bacterium]|mgnify:CR=1 FL=1|jgi:hypothetical protein|nr:hypothetical protein [Acidobacteriota bacterium]MDP7340453.1 hypothetical protein [Vicinamibacterales bacterium]MDP7481077.1 hypothetical protein [Vicinamibacterales bacterium]HJN44050.1 hypothetical protein [Vicinamibacterales bacterium]|tara:strand:+ start:255 stop:1265 length:1011 start_codon:yes stop_codon:yes gene_type:complete